MALRRKAATLDGWGTEIAAPRAEVKNPYRQAWKFVLLRAALIVLLISVPLLAGSLVRTTTALREATDTLARQGVSSVTDASVTGPARLALRQWLAADPSPLPGAQVLTAGDVATQPAPVVDPSSPNAPKVTFASSVVSFMVSDETGRLYTAAVQMAVDTRGSAVPLGTPSLSPLPPAAQDSWSTGSPWPGRLQAVASSEATKAVQAWASAYTSGDPAALRLAVGDPSGTAYYTPLSGPSVLDARIVDATALAADGSVLAARVELTVSWPGQPSPSPGAAQVERVPLTFDVLIERAATAAPVVTAWGAPGTGPSLTRYGNAADGTGRPAPTTAPTPSPSASPSTSASAG